MQSLPRNGLHLWLPGRLEGRVHMRSGMRVWNGVQLRRGVRLRIPVSLTASCRGWMDPPRPSESEPHRHGGREPIQAGA